MTYGLKAYNLKVESEEFLKLRVLFTYNLILKTYNFKGLLSYFTIKYQVSFEFCQGGSE